MSFQFIIISHFIRIFQPKYTINNFKHKNLHFSVINNIFQGVKVLVVVATNATTAAAIVRDAHKKNVKVIAYARIIKNCDLDYFITFNVEKIGELQADYILNNVPKGNYVLINGDKSDVNAIIEHNGVMKSLKPEIENSSY